MLIGGGGPDFHEGETEEHQYRSSLVLYRLDAVEINSLVLSENNPGMHGDRMLGYFVREQEVVKDGVRDSYY